MSLHHQALIQNSGPLIDMSDIRPGTSELFYLKITIFSVSSSTYIRFTHEHGDTVKTRLLDDQYMDTHSVCTAEPFCDRRDLSFSDPVSRKSIKSAHSSRNRYSSQWTLSRPSQSQSTASARTLTSDWRTMGSHGITATESDSYSASLSQDTGESIQAVHFYILLFLIFIFYTKMQCFMKVSHNILC